jgi:lysophospholipase L1-like esterase
MDIGIWGDSITFGAGDSEALGWVGRLRKHYFSDDEISIYNRGVCGNTTTDLLKRFDIEASSIRPDIIVFAIGINDSKFPRDKKENTVALEEFKQNIEKLLSKAKDLSEKIFVVGLTRVGEKWTDAGSAFLDEEISRYDNALKEITEKENLVFIPVSDALLIPEDLHDGLHPNNSGYQKMFDAIRTALSLH